MKKYIRNRIRKLIALIDNSQLFNNYFMGIATIFMLHRVHPLNNNKLVSNEGLKVSPEFLEKFILDLKSNGYTFISLDRLYEILQNNERVKKQIVFTLDDGYKDNYEIAYPIFKKYDIPFTIYLTASFPDKKAILWWYSIEDLILNNERIILSDGQEFPCKTIEEKNDTFEKLRTYIFSLKTDNFLYDLNKLFEKYNIDWFEKNKELVLNWEEIIELSKDKLVTIGGHTVNHFAFNQLSANDIVWEVSEANKIIEGKINKKIEHFAYPFGGKDIILKRECDIVKKLNFKTVTTTRKNNIYLPHVDHLECLPRVYLPENFRIEELGKIKIKRFSTI